MLAALLRPGLLDRQHDRRIMLCAGLVMMLGLAATAAVWLLDRWSWWVLAIAWIVLGVAYAGLVTPGGRLLRRSAGNADLPRSEEHTSELQSLMRISYAVFCLKKKKARKSTRNQ